MKAPKQTARFTLIVKECGRPEPATLWVSPREDKQFQAAVDQNRVLTIHQETVGTRKDFGVVGFRRTSGAAYLIFPKPLDKFEGKKIVGIDYALLELPKMEAGREGMTSKTSKSSPKKSAGRREPAPRKKPTLPSPRFRVIVRCVSTIEISREVEAKNKEDAKQKALASLARVKLDFSRGTQSRTAVRIERLRDTDPNSAALFRRQRGLPDLPDSGRDRG